MKHLIIAVLMLMCVMGAAAAFTCPADCDCFVVGADSRTYYNDFNKTLQFIKPDTAQFDFMVFPGDMEYVLVNKGSYTDVELSGLQTYWCVGNHEMDVGDETNISNLNTTRANVIYYYNDSLNTSYIVEYDKLYLVVLDEYREYAHGNIPENGPQYLWLEEHLALLDKGKKIFTVGHEPAYPENAHIGDSLDQFPSDRDALWSLFDENSVEAYFCGHTHYYSRNSSMLNVTQVDVGNMRWWGDGNSTLAYVAVNDTNAMVYIYSNSTKGEILDLIASYDVTNNYGADSRLLYHADNAANDAANKNWGTPRNGVDTQANTGVTNLGREGHFVAANDEYVQVPTSDSLNFGTGNFSISLWFNTSGTGTFVEKSYDGYSGSCGPGWVLYIWDDGRLEFALADSVGAATTVRTPTGTYYNDSQWHHVVISVGRGTNQVGWYVDGTHIENDDLGSRSGSVSCIYDLWIGANYNKGAAIDREFDGDMNEVAIYDKALDATEVGTLYNSSNGYQHTGSEAGLVSAWHMNEDTWVVLDSSGNGNNGTLTGGRYDDGIHNAAFKLDGTDDYVLIPHSSSLDLTGKEMALEAWVKWGITPGSGNSWAAIINKYGDNEWRLQHSSGNAHFEFAVGSGSVISTTTVQEGVWYHVVGTYNSTHLLMYVDGELENTASYSSAIPVSSSDVHLGRRTIGDRHINGSLDEIAIYNRSLSAAEVLAHYNEFAPTGNPCSDDVCVNVNGWWRDGGALNTSAVPIQDAVNNATAGETICVKDGTYYENVDVATRLTIRSENGSSVTTVNASNPNDYVFEVTVNYVNISGFTVENATGNSMSGIRLTGASYCNISYNDAIANWHGIYLYNGCGHNNITNNNASSNIQIGVLLHWVCSNNNVIDNVANSNTFHGFRIKEYGNYNLIKNNTAENNIDNGFYLYDSCNYNTIIDNTMNFNVDGIRVAKCHYTNVSNNTFANNTKGFHIIASRNNSFTCNYVHNSTGHGFYLTNKSPAVPGGVDSADNNISYNNIITNGDWQFNTSQASSADAKNNYWGTTISSEIAASIGENTGSVAYTPFLSWYSPCAPGYRPQSVSYIPPDPTNLASSTGDWWVNHTWQTGAWYPEGWCLVSGRSAGDFLGFNWTGSKWQSNSGIVSGIRGTMGYSAPGIFKKDGTWYCFTGAWQHLYDPDFGFNWTGSKWRRDTGIENGLAITDMESYATPTIFQMGGTWYILVGHAAGTFDGYKWTGSSWFYDSAIKSGLGDVGSFATPEVFQKDDTWYAISGNSTGFFIGWNWTGSTWQSDTAIVSGLGDIGSRSAPTVFQKGSTWYLISGSGPGTFYGFNWTGSTWQQDSGINNSLDPGSIGGGEGWSKPTAFYNSCNVTDSYSTNVNGIWYNGTANTHYNDTYSPLGWQNITVYAWNATGTGTLSAGSVSQNTQAPPPNTIVHTIPANQYGLIRKNGTADQTASEVAATIANDTCYAWFDKFWQGYRVVHGYNANTVIPKHQAYFVYVIAETDITCIITSAESVSIPEGYYLTYLREYTPKTLTAIKTDMGPNVNSLYAWTGTAWTDTGTHSVEPNEGLFVISSAAFVWDGSVP